MATFTSTPKLAWQNFDFVGFTMKQAFPIPIAWTTDVNAAAYGEYVFGKGKGLSSVVYYTIGKPVLAAVHYKMAALLRDSAIRRWDICW